MEFYIPKRKRMYNQIPDLEEGDFYYNEDGYRVFTAQYLLKRGYCCQNGCKHCPYGFDKRSGRIIKNKKNK